MTNCKIARRIADLLAAESDEDIIAALDRLYCEGYADRYREVLKRLRHVEPEASELRCELTHAWTCEEPPRPYVDVVGSIPGDNRSFAIEFETWRKWVGMPVIIAAELRELSASEVLAHVLYEITWGGWDER
jgi:hypothetical protein